MLRLAIFALLGSSFLTVQTHVIRERALSTPGIQWAADQLNPHRGEAPWVSGLGGGTTRALHEASDRRWANTATPSLAPRLSPTGSPSEFSLALGEVPPFPGAAPPVLRI